MQTSKLSLVNKNNKCVSIFYSYYGRLNYKFNPATLFIEVSVPSKLKELSYVKYTYIRGIYFVSVSAIFLLDFRTVLAVWLFFHFITKRTTKLKASIISHFANIMLEITSLVAAYNNVYHIPLHFAYTIVMSCQLKSEIAGSPKLVDEGGGGPQLSKHMVFTDGIDIGRLNSCDVRNYRRTDGFIGQMNI